MTWCHVKCICDYLKQTKKIKFSCYNDSSSICLLHYFNLFIIIVGDVEIGARGIGWKEKRNVLRQVPNAVQLSMVKSKNQLNIFSLFDYLSRCNFNWRTKSFTCAVFWKWYLRNAQMVDTANEEHKIGEHIKALSNVLRSKLEEITVRTDKLTKIFFLFILRNSSRWPHLKNLLPTGETIFIHKSVYLRKDLNDFFVLLWNTVKVKACVQTVLLHVISFRKMEKKRLTVWI